MMRKSRMFYVREGPRMLAMVWRAIPRSDTGKTQANAHASPRLMECCFRMLRLNEVHEDATRHSDTASEQAEFFKVHENRKQV